MKKYVLILITSLLTLPTCDDFSHAPIIGKWQLKSVEREGTIIAPVDTVWYNFQSLSVFLLQVYEPSRDSVRMLHGLRKQEDNLISIKLQLYWPIDLDYTDWETMERSFYIEHVTHQKLTLRSEEGYLYSFIKF